MPEQDFSVTKKVGRPRGRVQPETKPVRVPVPLLQALDPSDIPGHDEPSPAVGMAMQKGLAQNVLVDMKNERTRRNSSRQK